MSPPVVGSRPSPVPLTPGQRRVHAVMVDLAKRGKLANMADIARALRVSRTTIHAHMQMLVVRGWVQRLDDGRYRPIGPDGATCAACGHPIG